MNGEQYRNL